jgi:D-glycero-D-manno-heptose 1,7-bisphosphate phosphatase
MSNLPNAAPAAPILAGPPAPPRRPAVFLDRDGVIIENRADYVRSLADVAFLPGALEALARLNQARPGWAILMATNQSPVGRGLLTLEAVQAINGYVLEHVYAAGGRIDQIYLCPHHPQAGCACRKPAPGMLLQGAAEWGVDLATSVFIGDAASDVLAGLAAGVRPLLVRTGLGADQAAELDRLGLRPQIFPDLAAAIAFVLAGSPAHTNAP